MKYFIITASDADSMAETINLMHSRGWDPVGGLCSIQRDGIVVIMQLMERKEDK